MLVKSCQLCESTALELVLDLGFHPLADTFLKKEDLLKPEARYPLQVLLCKQCGHAMNSYVVSKKTRYQESEYSYNSANSKAAVAHFDGMAAEIIEKMSVGKGDLVVDIGGNVGTLLQAFRTRAGARVLNVEPSGNIADLAEKNGIPTVRDFWGDAAASAVAAEGGARIITITNAFNHIDELDAFMRNVGRALAPAGAFVIEVPYLLTLLGQAAFDTVYLEHISYFSVKPLASYFRRFGLAIMEVADNEYMGGSLRLMVGHGAQSAQVAEYVAREEGASLFDLATYESLRQRVRQLKISLLAQLIEAKRSGGTIIGVGAATKGNTLLNYCGIDGTWLEFITDASPLKIGKYTPGSHIPIFSDEAITSDITHALILPWNIGDLLRSKLAPKYPNLSFIVPHMASSW